MSLNKGHKSVFSHCTAPSGLRSILGYILPHTIIIVIIPLPLIEVFIGARTRRGYMPTLNTGGEMLTFSTQGANMGSLQVFIRNTGGVVSFCPAMTVKIYNNGF